MKAHSETHLENKNVFLEKWKIIDPFFSGLTPRVAKSGFGVGLGAEVGVVVVIQK